MPVATAASLGFQDPAAVWESSPCCFWVALGCGPGHYLATTLSCLFSGFGTPGFWEILWVTCINTLLKKATWFLFLVIKKSDLLPCIKCLHKYIHIRIHFVMCISQQLTGIGRNKSLASLCRNATETQRDSWSNSFKICTANKWQGLDSIPNDRTLRQSSFHDTKKLLVPAPVTFCRFLSPYTFKAYWPASLFLI